MNKVKTIVGVVLAVGFIIAGAYVAGRYYFMDHFYPRTTLNGQDVSFETGEEAVNGVKEQVENYVLGIKCKDGDMAISAAQCGLEYTEERAVLDALDKQDEEMWFKEVFYTHEIEAVGVSLDEAKLHQTVDSLSCMTLANPQKPVDAYIKYDDVQKCYLVVDEIIGNTVVPETFYEAIKEDILSGETILDMTTNEYYQQPTYTAACEDTVKAKTTLDTYMATVINYEDMGQTYRIDGNDIHNFIKIDEKMKITFDKELMKTFISEKISPVFNTVGKERTIKSPGSGTFKASGGTYGWQVGLIDERTAMIDDIKNGKEVTREPMYLQDAAVKDFDMDLGDTYVDVSISDQKLWVVQKGKVVMESKFVSGNPNKGHQTEKGIYTVERKQRHYVMRDYNVTVSYWMPFNLDVGEGFHDASWRSSFGGDIYLSDGSHGCVNLPADFAKKLYEFIYPGYPVIVH